MIEVYPTDQNFEYWYCRPYLSEHTKEIARSASILLVPLEDVPNTNGPVFPSEVRGYYAYLREHVADNNQIGICIDEEQFREIILRGRLLSLGRIVVTLAVAPLAMNLTSYYVQKSVDANTDPTVRFELTVTKPDGSCVSIKYDGPASTFEKLMTKNVSELSLDGSKKASENPIGAKASFTDVPANRSPRPIPNEPLSRDVADLSQPVKATRMKRERRR